VLANTSFDPATNVATPLRVLSEDAIMSKKLMTMVGVIGGVTVALVVAAVGFVMFQPKPRRLVAKYI
jgi:hypothetical protein